MPDQQLVMDRSVPFVDVVFRVIAGTAPLEHAIGALRQAEDEAGLMLVGDPVPFCVEGVMALKEGFEPPSFATVVRLSQERTGLGSLYEGAPSLGDSFYEETVCRLLDRTHLILTGGDLCNSYNFIAADHRVLAESGTWRWWGKVVAGWANRCWFSRPSGHGQVDYARKKRPWEYLDFYMREYVNSLVVDYDRWADIVLAVLREKNRQMFEEETRGE